MNDCLFCRIARHEIPSEVVYEDEATIAFLDIHPRAPGHTVVIAKQHSSGMFDLPDEALSPLFRAVKKVDDLLVKKLHADGLTIGVNQGKVSGQEVDHLHIHLFPRFTNDKGSAVQSVVNNPAQESVMEMRKKIVE